MISVRQGTIYRKENVIIFTGAETIPCPICGGSLKVRGTCRRKLITREGEETYRLRVMECKACGKTHRELPSHMIPFKRMDESLISDIASAGKKERLNMAESSTWRRVRLWVLWFLQYARSVLEGSQGLPNRLPAVSDSAAIECALAPLVRLVVNSGNWIQHRSALTASA